MQEGIPPPLQLILDNFNSHIQVNAVAVLDMIKNLQDEIQVM